MKSAKRRTQSPLGCLMESGKDNNKVSNFSSNEDDNDCGADLFSDFTESSIKGSSDVNTHSGSSQPISNLQAKSGKTFVLTLKGILDAVDFEGVWAFDKATLLSEKSLSETKIT